MNPVYTGLCGRTARLEYIISTAPHAEMLQGFDPTNFRRIGDILATFLIVTVISTVRSGCFRSI